MRLRGANRCDLLSATSCDARLGPVLGQLHCLKTDELGKARPWLRGHGYGSRKACSTVASIRPKVMGLTGDSVLVNGEAAENEHGDRVGPIALHESHVGKAD